jgi:molybdopterin-guanine dinucleotide biosynthesis protein A
MAAGPEGDGRIRTQPVFCLIKTELRPALLEFMQQGGRKIDAWTARQRSTVVRFDLPGDDPRAFFNINTLRDLDQLETLAASAKP